MEYIREVKIKIYIDTNKTTYEKEFNSIEEAEIYLKSISEDLGLE